MTYLPPVRFPRNVRLGLRLMWAGIIGYALLVWIVLWQFGETTGCNPVSSLDVCELLGFPTMLWGYTPLFPFAAAAIVQIVLDEKYRNYRPATHDDERTEALWRVPRWLSVMPRWLSFLLLVTSIVLLILVLR
jgi:hypothetical protein